MSPTTRELCTAVYVRLPISGLPELVSGYAIEDPEQEMATVCLKGTVSVAKYLHTVHAYDQTTAKNLFYIACHNGRIKTARWLHSTFDIPRKTVINDRGHGFIYACIMGHIKMVKWIYNTFHITREEVIANDNYLFEIICVNNHLKLAKWFHSTFDLTLDESRANDIFIAISKKNNMELMQWFCDTFTILQVVLNHAINYARTDKIKAWLLAESFMRSLRHK